MRYTLDEKIMFYSICEECDWVDGDSYDIEDNAYMHDCPKCGSLDTKIITE